MTDTIRDLLISLSSHMAYMQGQLEAGRVLDDPEDYYWYRESVLLRQKVADALADEPAVPQPPAEGEVAELVAELQSMATDADRRCRFSNAERLSRAADLLERLSPPQPVPVSERWPEFSDCDDTDRVWCWNWAIGAWRLNRINRSIHSHWLPAQALPLPGQEVE